MLKIAEELWSGSSEMSPHHYDLFMKYDLVELDQGLAFIMTFANIIAVETKSGIVLIDSGPPWNSYWLFDQVRKWTCRRLHTCIFTHGHVDHVYGLPQFEEEAESLNYPRVRVIAHESVPLRFDRYKMTADYHTCINSRQFKTSNQIKFPTDFRYPDMLFTERLVLDIGGVEFDLRHAKGETDDSTWIWIPKYKTICTGDLFIWATPNCGNPQKVQRYPLEWAKALREMLQLKAEKLCPGHGPIILGADRVERALRETAEFLESIVKQTIDLINEGRELDYILHTVKAPQHLLERPYLRPVYDEPLFIVRNLWRLYAGWWDMNPARLAPPPDAKLSEEIVDLAGETNLVERSLFYAKSGDYAMACSLIEFAWRSSKTDKEMISKVRQKIYEERSALSTSLMSTNIYRSAAEQSKL